jgi:hypothetical protein
MQPVTATVDEGPAIVEAQKWRIEAKFQQERAEAAERQLAWMAERAKQAELVARNALHRARVLQARIDATPAPRAPRAAAPAPAAPASPTTPPAAEAPPAPTTTLLEID